MGDAYTKACQDYIDVYAPALFDLLEVRKEAAVANLAVH